MLIQFWALFVLGFFAILSSLTVGPFVLPEASAASVQSLAGDIDCFGIGLSPAACQNIRVVDMRRDAADRLGPFVGFDHDSVFSWCETANNNDLIWTHNLPPIPPGSTVTGANLKLLTFDVEDAGECDGQGASRCDDALFFDGIEVIGAFNGISSPVCNLNFPCFAVREVNFAVPLSQLQDNRLDVRWDTQRDATPGVSVNDCVGLDYALLEVTFDSCGNGIVDGSEQCDLGANNGLPSSCCSPTCSFTSGNTCRAAVGACDAAETCNGISVNCPGDGFLLPGFPCRPAGGVCDLAESCDGNANCPVDVKSTAECRAAGGVCDQAESCDGTNDNCPVDAKSTAECRAAGGVCDQAESCDGTNDNCPVDTLTPAGTECRGVAGACDVSENCDGTNANCPADALAGDGSACDDGEFCTLGETCTGGTCGGATPNPAPFCDGGTGPVDITVTLGCEDTTQVSLTNVIFTIDGTPLEPQNLEFSCPQDDVQQLILDTFPNDFSADVDIDGTTGTCDIGPNGPLTSISFDIDGDSNVVCTEGAASIAILTIALTPQVIGGEIIPIETTSLILAGVQTPAVWMLSILSALGIGTFWIARNPYNVRNIKVILQDYLDRL